MITLLTNFKAFCLTALSVCLGLFVFGPSLHAQAQEVKSTPTDEQRRGSEEATGQQQDAQPSETKDRPTSVNKRPLQDWLRKIEELRRQGQLDLKSHFSLTVAADLLSTGEFTNLSVKSYDGDTQLLESANLLVDALSESHIFSLPEGTHSLVLELKLNESVALLNASLEATSPELAKRHANVYQSLFTTARITKRGQTEGIVFGHTKVSANGKQVIFTFTIPRAVLGELLDIKPSAP